MKKREEREGDKKMSICVCSVCVCVVMRKEEEKGEKEEKMDGVITDNRSV